MPFQLWARAQSKWRGIVVYTMLQAFANAISKVIDQTAPTPAWQLYGSLTGLATSVYCLIQIFRLLISDRDGDENWPPLWS